MNIFGTHSIKNVTYVISDKKLAGRHVHKIWQKNEFFGNLLEFYTNFENEIQVGQFIGRTFIYLEKLKAPLINFLIVTGVILN